MDSNPDQWVRSLLLELSREQILARRRKVSALETRLAHSERSLERAAVAGLQDSVPRAAVLSIHARVSEAGPGVWAEPPLVQVSGPRYSAYVIAESDLAVFTLGRLPEQLKARQRADDVADRLEAALGGERMDVRDVARIVGLQPNALRYAAPTGRFLIYWDGARQPPIWSVPAPTVDPSDARLELLRRHPHVFGPGTPDSFASWAGIRPKMAASAFDILSRELIAVRTPIGEACILASDESGSVKQRALPRRVCCPAAPPTTYCKPKTGCCWCQMRSTGAVMDVSGVARCRAFRWRHSRDLASLRPQRDRPSMASLQPAGRESIEAEAASMPLPGIDRRVTVTWED
jgi:hypothetical protein